MSLDKVFEQVDRKILEGAEIGRKASCSIFTGDGIRQLKALHREGK
jgi:hypothetical protein